MQNAEITYKLDAKDLKEVIAETMSKDVEDRIFGRFYNVMVDAKTLAKVHNLSTKTVSRYIADGTLRPEPTEGRLHLFRLSEVLKLEASKLKYKRK